ncbi:hypothetical protein [Frankia sp. CcWB2]
MPPAWTPAAAVVAVVANSGRPVRDSVSSGRRRWAASPTRLAVASRARRAEVLTDSGPVIVSSSPGGATGGRGGVGGGNDAAAAVEVVGAAAEWRPVACLATSWRWRECRPAE